MRTFSLQYQCSVEVSGYENIASIAVETSSSSNTAKYSEETLKQTPGSSSNLE